MTDSDEEPIIVETYNANDPRRRLATKKIMAFGIAQIIFGVLCLLAGLGLIINALRRDISSYCNSEHHFQYCPIQFSYFGTGIWCGVIFIISGSFAVKGAAQNNLCNTITLMTMSATAIPFGLFQVIIQTAALVQEVKSPAEFRSKSSGYVAIILISCSLLFGLIELVLLVLSTVYSSCITCCQKSPAYLEFDQKPATHQAPSQFYGFQNQAPPQFSAFPNQQNVTQMHGHQIVYGQQLVGPNMQPQMQPFMLVPLNQMPSGTLPPPSYGHLVAQGAAETLTLTADTTSPQVASTTNEG